MATEKDTDAVLMANVAACVQEPYDYNGEIHMAESGKMVVISDIWWPRPGELDAIDADLRAKATDYMNKAMHQTLADLDYYKTLADLDYYKNKAYMSSKTTDIWKPRPGELDAIRAMVKDAKNKGS